MESTLGLMIFTMAMVKSPFGLFLFFMTVSAMYALITFGLRKNEIIEIISVEEQSDFVFMHKTSVVALNQEIPEDVTT
ncbi:hypothetical protein [Desulfobacula sp.]